MWQCVAATAQAAFRQGPHTDQHRPQLHTNITMARTSLHCTALHCAALHCMRLRSTALHGIALRGTAHQTKAFKPIASPQIPLVKQARQQITLNAASQHTHRGENPVALMPTTSATIPPCVTATAAAMQLPYRQTAISVKHISMHPAMKTSHQKQSLLQRASVSTPLPNHITSPTAGPAVRHGTNHHRCLRCRCCQCASGAGRSHTSASVSRSACMPGCLQSPCSTLCSMRG